MQLKANSYLKTRQTWVSICKIQYYFSGNPHEVNHPSTGTELLLLLSLNTSRYTPLVSSVGKVALSLLLLYKIIDRVFHKKMALECQATYKVLVLGDSNVGKTCIVHRYCDETYYDTYISTIGKFVLCNLLNLYTKFMLWWDL